MPLDGPRDTDESGYDEPLPDQMMDQFNDNAVPDSDEDSDFGFTSEEDEANIANGVAHLEQVEDGDRPERYVQYQLVPDGPQPTGDDVQHGQQDGYYQHNYVVQWVDTDEPLFDRQVYEAHQARRQVAETDRILPTNQETNNETLAGINANSNSTTEIQNQTEMNVDNTPNEVLVQPCQSNRSVKPNEGNVTLDKEKIDIIKNLMSNFKLPETSVPNWAKEISEDQWKSYLNTKFKPNQQSGNTK